MPILIGSARPPVSLNETVACAREQIQNKRCAIEITVFGDGGPDPAHGRLRAIPPTLVMSTVLCPRALKIGMHLRKLLAPTRTTVSVCSSVRCKGAGILTGEAPGLQAIMRLELRAVSRARTSSSVAFPSRGISSAQREPDRTYREGASRALGESETGRATVWWDDSDDSAADDCSAI